jgi:hypothetical protein
MNGLLLLNEELWPGHAHAPPLAPILVIFEGCRSGSRGSPLGDETAPINWPRKVLHSLAILRSHPSYPVAPKLLAYTIHCIHLAHK